ncbi:MAG: DUF58 domain-containing protein [Bacteroidales bacterium]|nr:DUF58 domain-containing protein [Bacteroidales bacterium]
MQADKEILKRVRQIEIKARGLSQQLFSGEYHSAFKGRGMAFSEVREYQYGDDVRNIDWNVTARLNHPYVKVFEEERELTVMLLIDVSGSNDFGTNRQSKRDLITEVAATLAFSAIANNDKVGMILFSEDIELFIPPKKGKTHILRIIRELLTFQPVHRRSNVQVALQYLTNAIKKRSTVFLLSDFRDDGFTDALKIASGKHDVAALRVVDRHERTLPDIGLQWFRDLETGEECLVDTSSATVRNQFAARYKALDERTSALLTKYGIDSVELSTGEDYVKALIRLFRLR